MSDQRTKARLAVSEFQSASRAKFEAERDFTRAHDQLAGGAEVTRLEQAALRGDQVSGSITIRENA